MFVPSQKPLYQIKSEKYLAPAEEITYCKKCSQWIRYILPVVDSIPDNTVALMYKNNEQNLYYVCSSCRRWAFCGAWNILKPYGRLEHKTKDEWKILKKELFAKYAANIATFIYDKARQTRYETLTAYYWERYFSKAEKSIIQRAIDSIMGEGRFDFVDNMRVAKIGKKRQLKRYDEAKKSGCCGSYDTVISGYKIGFNYGH